MCLMMMFDMELPLAATFYIIENISEKNGHENTKTTSIKGNYWTITKNVNVQSTERL